MSFSVEKVDKDGKTFFNFVGNIDENASFPIIDTLSGEVWIDLQNVKSINSVGIRAWIKWFSSFEQVNFVFQNCPKAIVMQMNMVEGFLVENSRVESIQVPFYCESCDEDIEMLFHVGREVNIVNGEVELTYDKSSVCPDGSEPELDVNKVKYFKFLLKQNSVQSAA